MSSLALLGLLSFAISLLLTPFCRNLFLRWGVLDRPDSDRKLHLRAIPRVGGIPIVIAYFGAFAALLASGYATHADFPFAFRLLPATVLVFLVGLLDDLLGLRPWQKLLGQILASLAAVWAGVQITGIASFSLGWLGVFVTVLWLIGCTNAFNLIDGVDGLATGVGLFATVTTLMAAMLQHNMELAIATLPLAGALLGFLCYNFNPASIFLGDSGSLLIGFMLGCYSVLWSQKSATLLGMTAPLMALSIPLLDTGLAIVRRFLRHQPIFGADRGHIHHKLLARGLTPRRVALLIYGICGVSAGLSLLESVLYKQVGGAIIVLFCAGTWIGIQHLGYAEFGMASRLLLAGTFQCLLNAHLTLKSFQEDLNAAATPDQCWETIHRSYTHFGFNRITLKLAGREYSHSATSANAVNCWTIRINLSESDYVNLSRKFDALAPPLVAPFADSLGKILCTKAAALQEYEQERELAVEPIGRAPATVGAAEHAFDAV